MNASRKLLMITWLIFSVLNICHAESASLSTGVFRCYESPNDPRVKEIYGYLEIINNKKEELTASIGITWQPGVAIDIDGILNYSKLPRKDGQWTMTFAQDSFGNSGIVKFTPISNNRIQIEIQATKVVDGRAARQYGEYILIRSKK